MSTLNVFRNNCVGSFDGNSKIRCEEESNLETNKSALKKPCDITENSKLKEKVIIFIIINILPGSIF